MDPVWILLSAVMMMRPGPAEGARDSANAAAHGSDANVITDARLRTCRRPG